MSDVTPARVGLLIDYVDDDGGFDENILPSLQLVADEYFEQGVLERPVEFVVRAVQGLPNGSFRAVRDAFYELVEQDSLVIFGPWVSENGAALRPYVEELARSPASPWRHRDHARGVGIRAARGIDGRRADHHGHRGGPRRLPDRRHRVRGLPHRTPSTCAPQESPARTRVCASPRRCPSRRCNPKSKRRWRLSPPIKPDAIVHVGFGLGLIGMNDALREIGWMPPRYTHHRVRIRVDQPMVARTARRMDRARPVRRAQRGRGQSSSTDSRRATAADRSTSSRCTATTSAA